MFVKVSHADIWAHNGPQISGNLALKPSLAHIADNRNLCIFLSAQSEDRSIGWPRLRWVLDQAPIDILFDLLRHVGLAFFDPLKPFGHIFITLLFSLQQLL